MLAAMRLLAGMGTDVDGQGAALDETLVAMTPSTDIRTIVGVYAFMSDEVRLAIELLQSKSVQEADEVMNLEMGCIPSGNWAIRKGNPWYAGGQ